MSCLLSIAEPSVANSPPAQASISGKPEAKATVAQARDALGSRAAVLAGAALTGFFLLTAPSFAQVVRLGTTLSGSQEVPPNQSKGTGTLTASYDEITKKLSWSVSYSGLTGTAIAAHFHGPAEPGKNAPIEVPVPHPEKNPIQGTAVLTAPEASDLLSGKMYFNIHTKAHPGGEIRGQIKPAKPT
jgi:hypothetical protein